MKIATWLALGLTLVALGCAEPATSVATPAVAVDALSGTYWNRDDGVCYDNVHFTADSRYEHMRGCVIGGVPEGTLISGNYFMPDANHLTLVPTASSCPDVPRRQEYTMLFTEADPEIDGESGRILNLSMGTVLSAIGLFERRFEYPGLVITCRR